jgi:3-ketoacyl-CoA synthase
MINWAHVFTTYIPMLFVLGIGVLMALIVEQVVVEFLVAKNDSWSVWMIGGAIFELVEKQMGLLLNLRKEAIFSPSVEICFVVLVVMAWILRMDNPVYLLSFSTFKAPESWKISHADFINLMKNQ